MRIGIDVGGTKIEGIALAPAGEVLVRQRVNTLRDYAECLEAITSMVLAVEQQTGARASVGVGIPGTRPTPPRIICASLNNATPSKSSPAPRAAFV